VPLGSETTYFIVSVRSRAAAAPVPATMSLYQAPSFVFVKVERSMPSEGAKAIESVGAAPGAGATCGAAAPPQAASVRQSATPAGMSAR
jgi:hypothetical protein